jgi:hypothetical protein
MAFSSAGIITELTQLHPLDQAYRPWQTIVTESVEIDETTKQEKKVWCLNKQSGADDNYDVRNTSTLKVLWYSV